VEKVKIICPHCGFCREIEEDHVPTGQVTVTCPQCKQFFDYKKEEKVFTFQSVYGESAGDASVSSNLKYAGFWIRFVAYMIDGLSWLVVLVVLLKLVMPPGGARELILSLQAGDFSYLGSVTGIIAAVFFVGIGNVVYYTAGWNKWGRTIGMKIVGIKVVGYNGENIKMSQGFFRWLTGYCLPGIIPYLSALAYIVLAVMVGVNKKKQGWHDMAAKSYVVYE
jgi:uncharacterized RDD family membrane protein YckC